MLDCASTNAPSFLCLETNVTSYKCYFVNRLYLVVESATYASSRAISARLCFCILCYSLGTLVKTVVSRFQENIIIIISINVQRWYTITKPNQVFRA